MKKQHYIVALIVIVAGLGFNTSPTIIEETPSVVMPLEEVNTSLTKEQIFLLQHPKREFRSAWITTLTNLDWPSKRGLTSEQQKAEFFTILKNFQANSINSVIFQVRASSDAFYKSELSPWSEWLTGTQGKAPDNDFDPLQFMVKECHERNMEFHAWFNPFRAISHTKFSSIAKNHITNLKPEWFFQYGNTKYYNPGIPEVRAYIIDVVLEVVNNYDIDGVHFDDYFYPYTIGDREIPDSAEFSKYGSDFATIEDWRRNNINLLVEEVSCAIKEAKAHVKFGISPLAIWRNKNQDPEGSNTFAAQTNFDNLYSDTKLWMKNGWVDYMAPQLYGTTKSKYANYTHLVDWWSKLEYDHHLYVGHAIYKLDQRNGSYVKKEELIRQVEISRSKENICGNIYFRADAFTSNHQNFQKDLSAGVYKYPSLIPAMSWIDSIPPNAPEKLKLRNKKEGVLVKWSAPEPTEDMDTASYYVIYRYEESEEVKTELVDKILAIQKSTNFMDTTAVEGVEYNYIITAVDRLHNESLDCTSETIKRKN